MRIPQPQCIWLFCNVLVQLTHALEAPFSANNNERQVSLPYNNSCTSTSHISSLRVQTGDELDWTSSISFRLLTCFSWVPTTGGDLVFVEGISIMESRSRLSALKPARSPFPDTNSGRSEDCSAWVHLYRRALRFMKNAARPARAMRARPAMTPPAIAPAWSEWLGLLWMTVAVAVVVTMAVGAVFVFGGWVKGAAVPVLLVSYPSRFEWSCWYNVLIATGLSDRYLWS